MSQYPLRGQPHNRIIQCRGCGHQVMRDMMGEHIASCHPAQPQIVSCARCYTIVPPNQTFDSHFKVCIAKDRIQVPFQAVQYQPTPAPAPKPTPEYQPQQVSQQTPKQKKLFVCNICHLEFPDSYHDVSTCKRKHPRLPRNQVQNKAVAQPTESNQQMPTYSSVVASDQ